MTLSAAEREQWERDGFFVRRGFASATTGRCMADELIATIRHDPPGAHPGVPAYLIGDMLVQPEAKAPADARQPEDFVAKMFNTHLTGATREFGLSTPAVDIVADLLETPDIDLFQTQFILKNPGAWGQPWHQDSHYFRFDRQPQIGLWLAISRATSENGCLSVLPGSHRAALAKHHPDHRPGANQGYLEIHELPGMQPRPVLMEPGDLLVFHSYLMHRSEDNRAAERRAAMVYHYGVAGTVNLAPPETRALQDRVTRWVPARRAAETLAA